jgi:imidazoleglycerol-phosphate dehydratase/histidinol-phosphatase
MRKVLFIDRDGTIIKEPQVDFQVDSLDKLEFLPRSISALSAISRELDYDLVLVTNQDGLGTDSFPEADFWPAQNMMLKILASEGIQFEDIYIDPSFPEDNSPNRKPGTGMLGKYLYGNYDLENSYVIGDRSSDMELAINLGCQGIRIDDEQDPEAAFSSADWNRIYQFLKSEPRTARVKRNTSETQILVELNLDEALEPEIETGLGFFDHMLEQVARHGQMGIKLSCKGDLHIDEHHTLEDSAICLGAAFSKALGSKKGINRFCAAAPMDESSTWMSLDLSGRPYLVWDVSFNRERIGDVPTELFKHFFQSFCDQARCTLHIKCEGENEHHKIESVFKSFALCLKQAVAQNNSVIIPSSKGVL